VNPRRKFGVAFSAILLLSAAIGLAKHEQAQAGQAPKAQGSRITVRYTDIRQSAGITFRQDSTQTDEKYYLETMGTGVGWIDYDQDGLMDLYFVQSAATDIYKPPQPLRSALYRNNGDGTFTDVTEKAGVSGEGHYGQGVAIGDYDNDATPICTSPATAAPSSITITAMERLPTSPRKPVLPTKAAGPPAPDGLTMTRMAGSIWSLPTTSSGRRKQISGAANAARAIAPTAIQATTKVRRPSSTITITTAHSRTSAISPALASRNPRAWE
jgi:hypothetical protein